MSARFNASTDQPPRPRQPVRKVNRKRRAALYKAQFGDKALYVRSLPCCVCHKPGPSDPHHVRSRGAGGTSKDLVPFCRRHHMEYHATGRETFARRHGIDLEAKAARYEEWYHNDPQDMGF